jgi:signal transduction histidine kinase
MWDFTKENVTQVLLLRILAVILCLILLIKPIWPVYCKKYFNLYWHLTLTITLPFNALFILISEQWSIICLINAILSIFLLSMLTSWLSFIILLTVGCCSAFTIYYYCVSNILFSSDIYLNYIALYSYIFSILIVLIFTRRKEDQSSSDLYLAKLLGGTVAHELRTYLLTIRNYVHPIISSNKPKETQIYLDEINKTLDEAFSFIDILLTNIQGPKPIQKLTKLSIQDCMDYAISSYPISKDKKDSIINNIEHDFFFLGEKEMITHVIFNLINNAIYYSSNRNDLIINVSTIESWKYNYLIFYDNGPGIKQDMINKIFNKFYTANKKGSGLGLPFCKISMQLIGGNILCNSVEGHYTEFKLQFPKIYE